MAERKISLRLDKPEKMEGDTIYVIMKNEGVCVLYADVMSNIKFSYYSENLEKYVDTFGAENLRIGEVPPFDQKEFQNLIKSLRWDNEGAVLEDKCIGMIEGIRWRKEALEWRLKAKEYEEGWVKGLEWEAKVKGYEAKTLELEGKIKAYEDIWKKKYNE